MKIQIDEAVAVLRSGGIILYPTDTIWGIGCDATNPKAVEKIYKLKESGDKKSMLVLVDSVDNVARYTGKVPEVAWQLLELSDKPLTLILPGAHGIAENLIPEEGSVGIRVPGHEFCHALLRRFGRPLVSTSANISGQPAPAFFGEISEKIKNAVDLIVDLAYEKGATGKASPIIQLKANGEVRVIRE